MSVDAGFDYEAAIFACTRGDRAALRQLYEREARWLMGVALRIVRRQELADEVLHDSFLQIWEKSSTFNSAFGSARGWIYSVVRHRALDVARRVGREASSGEADLESLPYEGPGPLDSLSRSSDALELHRCLEGLDEQKRACILLAYVDGHTQTQIAHRLNSPLGTVKAWIRRGLLALKECLS